MSIKTDPRTEYTAGLRALADLLDTNPDMPLPYGAGTSDEYDSVKLNWYVQSKVELVSLARTLGGKLDKKVDDDSDHYGFELHGSLRGLHFYISAPRSEVCERVVTGTREVTKEVPTGVETVTVTEDVVEWRCHPILTAATA